MCYSLVGPLLFTDKDYETNFVNTKDLYDIFYINAAFECPNKTNVMIITLGTSVTRAILRFQRIMSSAEVAQRSKRTEENKHGAVIAGSGAESETVNWDKKSKFEST